MCNLTIKRAETEELIALTSHHLTDETRQAAYDGKNVLRVRACALIVFIAIIVQFRSREVPNEYHRWGFCLFNRSTFCEGICL